MTEDEKRAKNTEKSRKYRAAHPEYFRAYDRKRSAKRSESSPRFDISKLLARPRSTRPTPTG
jgi:hypothetical protein